MKTRVVSLMLALMLLALMVGAVSIAPLAPAQAADAPLTVITVNTAAITASTNWTGRVWADGYDQHTTADIYWFIDQGGTPNTLTVKLQTSPDGTNWADHTTLVSNNVADANSYTSKSIVGKFFRLTGTAGNSQSVTPTLKVVLR